MILDVPLLIVCVIVFGVILWTEGLVSGLWHLISGIIMFLMMLLVKIVGDKKFKRESLGGGDVKLSFLFGLTLNFYLGVLVLVIGSFLTYPMAVYYIFKKKEVEIPFGPFLVTGLVIVFVLQNQLTEILRLLIL